MVRIVWTEIASPVGHLLLTADGGALTGVWFVDDGFVPPRDGEQSDEDRALAATGTPFQLRVWTALLGIPYGTTVSYGEVARRLGLPPGASRAVGLANGANPIAIVVPCHRVIGADGRLTGYGGGLDRKRFLLDLEQGALF